MIAAAVFLLVALEAARGFADPGDLVLWYRQPALKWVEALPIGNGRLGAMVFGGTAEARYQFNDDTLFTGEPHDYAHRGAVKYLPVLRQLLFEGKQREAHELGNREFMSISTRGTNRQEAYQPFGDPTLKFPGHDDAEGYRRQLDLDQAIASVRYRVGGVTFRREVFASYPDNVIVVRLEADQPGRITCEASLSSPQEGTTVEPSGADTLVMAGQVENGKTHFQARLVVRATGGETRATGSGIAITGADSATLLLVGASSFVNFRDIGGDPAARNQRVLEKIGARPCAELRAAHVADHQELFHINTEMNYWPAEATNLGECAQPLFDAVRDLSQSGAVVAREHYGARGWVVHHNFDLWRGAAPINNANHGIWVTGGAWLCQHLWWHYQFSGDRKFLAETAYPLMQGAASFFVDYLIEDPRNDGKWLISGSCGWRPSRMGSTRWRLWSRPADQRGVPNPRHPASCYSKWRRESQKGEIRPTGSRFFRPYGSPVPLADSPAKDAPGWTVNSFWIRRMPGSISSRAPITARS